MRPGWIGALVAILLAAVAGGGLLFLINEREDAATATATVIDTGVGPVSSGGPIAEFVDAWAGAQAERDVDELLALLHPAVVERYGADQCKAYLARTSGSVRDVTLGTTSGPVEYTYTTDGRSTTFPAGYRADVRFTSGSASREVTMNLVEAGGRLRWFTDCGTAL